MADQHEVDLDSIIDRLLEVRGSRPGKQVQLLESEIRFLCTKAREIFISQPILLELEAPIKVCLESLLFFAWQLEPFFFPCDPRHRGATPPSANWRHFPGARLTMRSPDLRRYPRAVLRLVAPLRVRRLPPGG